jgi:hypothetical protein
MFKVDPIIANQNAKVKALFLNADTWSFFTDSPVEPENHEGMLPPGLVSKPCRNSILLEGSSFFFFLLLPGD